MIAQSFVDQAQLIPYPETTDKNERFRLLKEYTEAQARIDQDFATALANEYLSEIAESRRQAVAKRTFELAWEHGHSSGYSEVESFYMDFASFALLAYSAATS